MPWGVWQDITWLQYAAMADLIICLTYTINCWDVIVKFQFQVSKGSFKRKMQLFDWSQHHPPTFAVAANEQESKAGLPSGGGIKKTTSLVKQQAGFKPGTFWPVVLATRTQEGQGIYAVNWYTVDIQHHTWYERMSMCDVWGYDVQSFHLLGGYRCSFLRTWQWWCLQMLTPCLGTPDIHQFCQWKSWDTCP